MENRRRSVRTIVSEDSRKLKEDKWLLEVGTLWIYEIMLRFCAFWWVIDRRERYGEYGRLDKYRVIWILGWSTLLAVMWAINPGSKSLSVAFSIIAILRLTEISTTGLGTVLNRQQQTKARSLTTIAIYVFQAALIFAILDHTWASKSFVSGSAHASSALAYLFISWSSVTHIGNNVYVPGSHSAMILQTLTSTFGILLLGILLAYGLNSIPKAKD